jgi:hypothetical protein
MAPFEKLDVVMKIPFFDLYPNKAPANFCISGLPTGTFHLFA